MRSMPPRWQTVQADRKTVSPITPAAAVSDRHWQLQVLEHFRRALQLPDLSLRGGQRPTWRPEREARGSALGVQSRSTRLNCGKAIGENATASPRLGLSQNADCKSVAPLKVREPLNKSAAALSGSFAPTYRFENLEILRSRWRLCRLTDAACPLRVHKVFLQFPNLNLEQNPSLTALAI